MANEAKAKFSISRFFKDMVGELKKVVWPSKKQVRNNTAIVIAFIVVVAIVIAGFDFGLSALLKLLFGSAF